jgi:sugar lactone lactonase YvrE
LPAAAHGIAVAADGNYYVTEIGTLNAPSGRLLRVTPTGGVSVVALHR